MWVFTGLWVRSINGDIIILSSILRTSDGASWLNELPLHATFQATETDETNHFGLVKVARKMPVVLLARTVTLSPLHFYGRYKLSD